MGNVAYDQGNYKQAKKLFEESLAIYKEIGYKIGMVDSVNYLGNAAYKLGDFKKAVKLLSSAEKELESMEAVLDKKEQEIKDGIIAKLHEQFNVEEFVKYWEEGERMTLEEACKLALSNNQI